MTQQFFFLYQYFKMLKYHLLDSKALDGEGLKYRNFLNPVKGLQMVIPYYHLRHG